MPKTRFVMIGGFLGAGKTTAIAKLAAHFQKAGLKVGIVTNDQANNLVDTKLLRSHGFDVGEVPGACFCCKFDDLLATTAQLSADQQPDLILTEPVGSCTDLVATVVEPLRQLHGDRYEVGKLIVLCKPEHGQKILGEVASGFSPKAAYIFEKQLEEADTIVINKADKLSAQEAAELKSLIVAKYPTKSVLLSSTHTGEGFEQVIAEVQATRTASDKYMDVDYEVYAEGEAELAWLNASVSIKTKSTAFDLDEVVLRVVKSLGEGLAARDDEPAHLKVLGFADGETSVANLVSNFSPPELSLATSLKTSAAQLLVNARVATDPAQLASLVNDTLADLGNELGFSWVVESNQHFRPGKPTPTHRYA